MKGLLLGIHAQKQESWTADYIREHSGQKRGTSYWGGASLNFKLGGVQFKMGVQDWRSGMRVLGWGPGMAPGQV